MTLTDATSSSLTVEPGTWAPICPVERLTPDRGVAALVDGDAVAVFLLSSGELYAVSNVEPFTGASVLSRGLVGEVDGLPTVASPLHKQRFDLSSGRCLDVADAAVRTYATKLVDGVVHVGDGGSS
ncbi:MAG: nitrite reductase small subunit NirD [Microthrixaceae bacterium]